MGFIICYVLVVCLCIGYYLFKKRDNVSMRQEKNEIVQKVDEQNVAIVETQIGNNEPDMDIKAVEQRFIAIDVETTGLNFYKDKIVEIAAVIFENGEIIDKFSSLVNPCIPIPKEATNVNHITNEMLSSAPSEKEVYAKLVDFLGDAMSKKTAVVAHNANFDISFISPTLHSNGYKGKMFFIDTLSLAKKHVKRLDNYKLKTLTNFFNIENENEHRALSDAIACGQMFLKLLELEKEDKNVYSDKYEKRAEFNKPNEKEIKVCAWIKKILKESGQDTNYLRFKRKYDNSIECICGWGFLTFKFGKCGSYVVVPNKIATKSKLECVPCSKKEGKEYNQRVLFNSFNDLKVISKYICSEYEKNYEYKKEVEEMEKHSKERKHDFELEHIGMTISVKSNLRQPTEDEIEEQKAYMESLFNLDDEMMNAILDNDKNNK